MVLSLSGANNWRLFLNADNGAETEDMEDCLMYTDGNSETKTNGLSAVMVIAFS